jgi:hypothetical protein
MLNALTINYRTCRWVHWLVRVIKGGKMLDVNPPLLMHIRECSILVVVGEVQECYTWYFLGNGIR